MVQYTEKAQALARLPRGGYNKFSRPEILFFFEQGNYFNGWQWLVKIRGKAQ
jgi:hypothetical protein